MLTGDNKIAQVKVDWPETEMKSLDSFVHDNVESQKQKWMEFHSIVLPEERKIYTGVPRDERKSFPWDGASNIVIQVVGQHIDTLQARMMGSIWELSPIWPVELTGKFEDSENAEEMRDAMERAMHYFGINRKELDFYRVESLWCADTLKHGFGVIKAPHVEQREMRVVGIEGTQSQEVDFLKYSGPRPEKVILDDFYCTPDAQRLEDCGFIAHRLRLTKNQLEERTSVYSKENIDKVIACPDSNGPSKEKIEEYEKLGLNLNDCYNSCEYHVFECWFPYYRDGRKYWIIHTYHPNSRTRLRAVFNFYPKNELPFRAARMGYTTDGIVGMGFCKMLKHYQEEITTGHNQRVDKRTLCNTSIFRIDPNSRLDANFRFYPGMAVPAAQGEFEVMPAGANNYPDSVNDEMLSLKLAEDRSGVGPSTSGGGGLGSGTVGKTSGAYSAMGTYSVMQDQNRRVAANITDFKYAHYSAGELFARLYASFGIGDRDRLFGANTEKFKAALDAFANEKLAFSVRAATASVNREVEKQNYLLLTTVMRQHYTAIAQLLQGVVNQQVPPEIKEYLVRIIRGSDTLMEKVLKSFNLEDDSRILPEAKIVKELLDGRQQPAGNGPGTATQGNTSANPVEQIYNSEQGGNPQLNALASLGQAMPVSK